jgi:hypothetical protein
VGLPLELIGPMVLNGSIMVQLLAGTIFLDAVFGPRGRIVTPVDSAERSASKVNRTMKLGSIYRNCHSSTSRSPAERHIFRPQDRSLAAVIRVRTAAAVAPSFVPEAVAALPHGGSGDRV